jgi:hypothetical protein
MRNCKSNPKNKDDAGITEPIELVIELPTTIAPELAADTSSAKAKSKPKTTK